MFHISHEKVSNGFREHNWLLLFPFKGQVSLLSNSKRQFFSLWTLLWSPAFFYFLKDNTFVCLGFLMCFDWYVKNENSVFV